MNVGGGSKSIALPPEYEAFEHLLLDIDLDASPDIVCDARRLRSLEPAQFDAVYCAHNLEHYYRHEVPGVLAGFLHVLKEGGFAHLRVPDLAEVMRLAVERKLDLEDALYQSALGPITVLDVLYGYGAEIERSGRDYYAHKTGFTRKSLPALLQKAGFSKVHCWTANLEVIAVAFKGAPDAAALALFRLA